MERTKVARGIVCWTATERRSVRYGSIYVTNWNMENTISSDCWYDNFLAQNFVGRIVKLTAVVLESRVSGHCGDMTLKLPENPQQHITPSQPEVGEEIVVGVGLLSFEPPKFPDTGWEFVLRPLDGRYKFWIDPRVLYRLHDQTVELFLEETPEDPLPITDLLDDYQEGKVYVCADDGKPGVGLQTREDLGLQFTVKPNIERVEGIQGCFMLKQPSKDDPIGTTYEVGHKE